jgi:hypothetical protein
MRIALRTLGLAAAGLALSGCLSVGDVANRGTVVDLGVGSMQNRGILLNLARASLSEPLYFLTPSAVQATGSTDVHLGGPSFVEGPGMKHSDVLKQLTFGSGGSQFLDNQMSTNFTANLFATHDFYLGLMTPLSLDEVDLLLHQGYSRELVFYLVIDKAKITPFNPGGAQAAQPHFDYNRPGDPSFPEFQDFIQAAMEHGLTTEQAPGAAPSAPSAAADSSKPSPPPPLRQTCFEPALASPSAMNDFSLVHVNFCGSGQPPSATQLVLLNGKAYKIEVVFRSTYGIFRYLGGLIRDPAGPPVLNDFSKDYPAGVPEFTPSGSLFKIYTSGGAPDGCFTWVQYEQANYCAPKTGDGADTTREIFNILSALVALKQSSGDIPASSAILIP